MHSSVTLSTFLFSRGCPSGILDREHDKRLLHEDIVSVINAFASMLVKGGTAFIFLDKKGMLQWEKVARAETRLSVDKWFHVSCNLLSVCITPDVRSFARLYTRSGLAGT